MPWRRMAAWFSKCLRRCEAPPSKYFLNAGIKRIAAASGWGMVVVSLQQPYEDYKDYLRNAPGIYAVKGM